MHKNIINVQFFLKKMTSSKTRNKLIDVARQLFAKDGVENTTMNDIALASKKGRRTLYTYFKCKEDIYVAVVESELDKLFDKMKKAAERENEPDKKIVNLIMTHLDIVKEAVYRNGTLRGSFFRDIWKVEKVRKSFDQKEIVLYKEVLDEGVQNNIFKIENTQLLAQIIHFCVKGLEVPYTRGIIASDIDDSIAMKYVTDIVYGALGRNRVEQTN